MAGEILNHCPLNEDFSSLTNTIKHDLTVTNLRMRWLRRKKNSLLQTAASARVAAAATALVESSENIFFSDIRTETDVSEKSNADLERPGLLTLIVD